MAYRLNEIWNDIVNGKLSLLFDSESNMQDDIFLVSKYCNYENCKKSKYDLVIMDVSQIFLKR